jgi:hypothetical protein
MSKEKINSGKLIIYGETSKVFFKHGQIIERKKIHVLPGASFGFHSPRSSPAPTTLSTWPNSVRYSTWNLMGTAEGDAAAATTRGDLERVITAAKVVGVPERRNFATCPLLLCP